MRLVLASASPRRHHMLAALGLDFDVAAADVDETPLSEEDPIGYTERVARSKAETVWSQLPDPDGVVVLAADTTVDVEGEIVGKPVDDDDARRMLRAMSGRAHRVHTSVVARTAGDTQVGTVTTEVHFVPLSEAQIERYLALGDHRDKAGAYGMQSAGGVLVRRIDGSPSNVIGLPLAETVALLEACGVVIG